MLVLNKDHRTSDQQSSQQVADAFYADILGKHNETVNLEVAMSDHTKKALFCYAKNLMLAHPGHVKSALTAHEVEMSVQMLDDSCAQYRQHMVDMYLESGTFPAALIQKLSQVDNVLSAQMSVVIIDILVAAAVKMFPEDHALVAKGSTLVDLARFLELRKEIKNDTIQGYVRG